MATRREEVAAADVRRSNHSRVSRSHTRTILQRHRTGSRTHRKQWPLRLKWRAQIDFIPDMPLPDAEGFSLPRISMGSPEALYPEPVAEKLYEWLQPVTTNGSQCYIEWNERKRMSFFLD